MLLFLPPFTLSLLTALHGNGRRLEGLKKNNWTRLTNCDFFRIAFDESFLDVVDGRFKFAASLVHILKLFGEILKNIVSNQDEGCQLSENVS